MKKLGGILTFVGLMSINQSVHAMLGGSPVSSVILSQQSVQLQVLFENNNDDLEADCSGTFISRTEILTARHCFVFNKELKIKYVMGSQYGKNASMLPEVQSVRLHRSKDLAVVTLKTPVNVEIGVTPAYSNEFLKSNLSATLVGTGYDPEKDQVGDLKMALLRTRVVSDDLISLSRVGNSYPCGGDSGGPLLVNDGHNLVIVGVYSANLTVLHRHDCRGGALIVTKLNATELRNGYNWISLERINKKGELAPIYTTEEDAVAIWADVKFFDNLLFSWQALKPNLDGYSH